MTEHPRVIIIQTTPYSTNNSSRSLDSYFHYWEKDRVRQIFSRNWVPRKGHCGELYQIKDSELLKKWLHRSVDVGTIYRYQDLDDQGSCQVIETDELSSKGYSIGRMHTPTIELMRGLLWKKKYWCTEKLIEWLDDYKPEIIFYNFTNNLFLQKIALFIADRYNIPIITAIGDDYYFNDKKSASLAYHLFRKQYKKLTEKIFAHPGSAVYVCDKIRDKYNERFFLDGETIYFNSAIKRKAFTPINTISPKIVYFGNIRLGRNIALKEVADVLGRVNSEYKLEIYSNEQDEIVYKDLKEHPNVVWAGAIPYSEVMNKTSMCDIYVVVESFEEKDINYTRYSLSTKAADGLASGAAVLAYGPSESGLIDYLYKTKAAVVCTEKNELENIIRDLLSSISKQREIYEKAIEITNKNHTLESSTAAFERVIYQTLNKK
ncbi:MAG: glycosyltransferase [Erysipelotrichaceae bacterium]|nr:glycosyltransferase [Erysipelotrichaceae bacterium]